MPPARGIILMGQLHILLGTSIQTCHNTADRFKVTRTCTGLTARAFDVKMYAQSIKMTLMECSVSAHCHLPANARPTQAQKVAISNISTKPSSCGSTGLLTGEP